MSSLNTSDLTGLTGTVVGIATMLLDKLDVKLIIYNSREIFLVPGLPSKKELIDIYNRHSINVGDDRDMYVYCIFAKDQKLIDKQFQYAQVYTQRLFQVNKIEAKRVASVDFKPFTNLTGLDLSQVLVSPIPKTLYFDKTFLANLINNVIDYKPLYDWLKIGQSVEQIQGKLFIDQYMK